MASPVECRVLRMGNGLTSSEAQLTSSRLVGDLHLLELLYEFNMGADRILCLGKLSFKLEIALLGRFARGYGDVGKHRYHCKHGLLQHLLGHSASCYVQ